MLVNLQNKYHKNFAIFFTMISLFSGLSAMSVKHYYQGFPAGLTEHLLQNYQENQNMTHEEAPITPNSKSTSTDNKSTENIRFSFTGQSSEKESRNASKVFIFPFVDILVHEVINVGIDVEQNLAKEKAQHEKELTDAGVYSQRINRG